jgi:hypothetical protein
MASLIKKLESNTVLLNLWAVSAAFFTYFSMYMFRKPFTAASFEDSLGDWDQKPLLLSAQVIGYLISKIIGVRVVSQMQPGKRAVVLIGLILLSHAALLLFAVVPAPWHVAAIFLNGLPLGMVFGLVLGFLEGRKMTEALTAGLCASFILAGGFSKTVGQWTLQFLSQQWQLEMVTAERWMPFLAGALFFIPLLASVWMLVQIPPPSAMDREARSERSPMNASDRRRILGRYALGITCIAIVYFLATILRSLRDDFAPEILRGMGVQVSASVYTSIDFYVAAIVLVVNGLGVLIVDNRKALIVSFVISLVGFVTILTALVLTEIRMLTPVAFLIVVGAGLYLPYVAIHTTVFERMIAVTRDRGNIGFLMYVVDSLGYLGYVGIMLLRNVLPKSEENLSAQILSGFRWTCWISAIISIFFVIIAIMYFARLRVPDEGTTQVEV